MIAEAVFAVLRRRMEFAHLAEGGTRQPGAPLALLGLMQTAGRTALKPFVSETEYAVARTRVEDRPGEPAAARFALNLPDWIYQALMPSASNPTNWRNWPPR